MQLETPLFGLLDINEQEIIHFPSGIPGFEDVRKFIFIHPAEDIPFHYMQCVDQPELCLVVTDPFLFYRDYEFELSETAQAELQVEEAGDVAVWSIVSIKDKLRDATLNLLAPVVVNTRKRLGKQVVLHDTPYTTKHRLVRETVSQLNDNGGEGQ